MKSNYASLYTSIEYTFCNADLLTLALTHSSCAGANYERLEFLGDAFLDFAVGEYLYEACPASGEGDLSKMRAQLVSNDTLSRLFDRLGIKHYLISVNLSLSNLSEKVRANFVESLVGAIYLDGGTAAATRFVRSFVCSDTVRESDVVSRLYELCAAEHMNLKVEERAVGDVHTPAFTVSVTVDGRLIAEATAHNIRHAKQAACLSALRALS